MTSPRHVHVIWCDDIRQEIGNKPSFMGVYTGGLVVQALPVVLPRLAIWSWVITPIEQPITKLRLIVVRDDGQQLAEIAPDRMDEGASEIPSSTPDATKKIFMFGLGLGSVELPADCKYLTVKVETESETLEGPRLPVMIAEMKQATKSAPAA